MGMEEFALYGGKITLKYDDAKHKYVAIEEDGRVIDPPSITTVLGIINKPALLAWAVNCAIGYLRNKLWNSEGQELTLEVLDQWLAEAKWAHKRVKEDAADIGSQAHQWIEDYWYADLVGHDPPPLPENELVRNCCVAFLKWISENKVEVILIEKPLYSRLYRVAGRMDMLARVNGKLAILDWKSSNQIWNEYRLQTSAYAKFYEEEFPDQPIEECWIVRLGKYDGEFEAKRFDKATMEADFKGYEAAIVLHRWQKQA